jgi:hypothetical protein
VAAITRRRVTHHHSRERDVHGTDRDFTLIGLTPQLLADHQDCKRTGNRRPLWPPASPRRWRRRGPALLTHGEEMVRLAVERDRSSAVHRIKVLLHLETSRALLLNDSQGAVSMGTEGFHSRRVEHRAIRPARERQTSDNLAVRRAENHHHRLWGLGRRISRVCASRKKHMILGVQCQPVASPLVTQRIVRHRLHRLYVDSRDAARHVLHDDVERAFAVAHALLRHAAQIDRAEHVPSFASITVASLVG